MSILPSVIGAGGGIIGAGINAWSQQKTNDRNEALMRESWERDDTAVQRSVADFEAAGLSKTLAAGNSAGNSGPIKLESPEWGNIATGAITGAAAANQVAQTKAQAALINSQKDKVDSEKKGQDLQNQLLADQTQYSTATLAWRIQQADYETLKKWNETLKSDYDAALASLKVSEQEKQNLYLEMKNRIMAQYGLTEMQAEVATKQAIADYARYETDRYSDAGTVKGGILPSALTSWLAEFNKLMTSIFGGGR